MTLLMIAIVFMKPEPKFHSFSKEQARLDIRSGQVLLITFGIAGADREIDRISSKYGFREYHMGCVVGYNPEEKEYSELVAAYLERRNGKGWRERYYKDINSLRIKQEWQNP